MYSLALKYEYSIFHLILLYLKHKLHMEKSVLKCGFVKVKFTENVIYRQTLVQQQQHQDQKVLQVVDVKKENAMKEVETEAAEAVDEGGHDFSFIASTP